MAVYQGMPYIAAQLDSILGQLHSDDEVVVSDNGSTDGTLEYLQSESQKDSRIRIFTLPAPRGVQPNFQNALQQCRGDIIFLSDQDDVWKGNKVDVISLLFDSDPHLLAVQADAELIDSAGRTIAPSFFAIRKCGPGFWKNYTKNTWQGCSMAFHRSILDLALPFPAKVPMHDMWIGMLADLSGHVVFLPEVLISYRRHEDNRTAMKKAPWYTVITWRLRLGRGILARLVKIRKFAALNRTQ